MPTTRYSELDSTWAPPGRCVDDNGAEYTSVQAAVDNSYSLVLVGPGTFEENVLISGTDNDGLTLLGVGEASVLDGLEDGPAVEVQSDGVTLSRMTIRTTRSGPGGDCVYLNGSMGPKLSDITVPDAGSDAVQVSQSPDSRITNVTVDACGANGVQFVGSTSDAKVSSCTFGTGIADNGVKFDPNSTGASGNSVVDCHILGVGFRGVASVPDDTVVSGNVIKNPGNDGIYLNGANCLLDGNRIIGAGRHGIVDSGTNNTSSDNVITGSADVPINTSVAAFPKLSNNVEDGTVTEGPIKVIDSGTVTLSSGSAVVSTGFTSLKTGNALVAFLDPSAGGSNDADVKARAVTFYDNSAGEYKVEILEDGTNVGNPDVAYKVVMTDVVD